MSGLGLCVLPEFTVKEELESGRLVKIPYSPNCDISIQLIYHKDKWLSNNMKDFIYMSEQFLPHSQVRKRCDIPVTENGIRYWKIFFSDLYWRYRRFKRSRKYRWS